MTAPVGARRLTSQTAAGIEAPSDMRMGTVSSVSARGIDVTVAEGLISGAAHLPGYNPAVGDPVAMVRFQDAWLVLGRPVGPGTATDYASAGLALGMPILDGCVLSGTGNDMATSTGAETAVPRYGVTYFHPPNHWVMILMTYSWYSSVASDVLTVRVKEAAAGTQASVDHIQPGVGGIGQFSTFALMTPPTLGGAKRSYSLTVQRFSGSGTVRVFDPSTRRGSMIAYDIGDAGTIRTV